MRSLIALSLLFAMASPVLAEEAKPATENKANDGAVATAPKDGKSEATPQPKTEAPAPAPAPATPDAKSGK